LLPALAPGDGNVLRPEMITAPRSFSDSFAPLREIRSHAEPRADDAQTRPPAGEPCLAREESKRDGDDPQPATYNPQPATEPDGGRA